MKLKGNSETAMECRGAIFDMDGLLFDTEKVFQQTWHEIAYERGVTLPDSYAREISGTTGEDSRKIVEKYYKTTDGRAVIEECKRRVRKKLEKNVPEKPGVENILRRFRENGIRTAVASSSDKELIENNLRVTGLAGYFDEVVSGKEVKRGKPAPDIFLLAAERIGCSPCECYVFEDSENGIRAGAAAGCFAVMVPDLVTPSDEVRELCGAVCESLDEAAEVLMGNGISR
ncbi:HAD family phosphatase [Ruminococcus sp. CLA-AA-H200]|uniref:HAD family phosphatase n=1 Tax=Ruminococcus turbiniformis TaxID=2881258 RepID=A0ABS8FY85_9FIRM|nr:HAD family phosphatase [Ruminococcus turbiniformis]MCC2254991.1 HAD family phosphatase [Ruminococcus turbiniformis]